MHRRQREGRVSAKGTTRRRRRRRSRSSSKRIGPCVLRFDRRLHWLLGLRYLRVRRLLERSKRIAG